MLSWCTHGLQIWRPSMASQVLLVFEIWRFLWLFQYFSEKCRSKNLIENWFLKPIMGCCQGTLRDCKSGVQVWLLNSFWFSKCGVFYDFSYFFFKKMYVQKVSPTWNSHLLWCCQGTPRSCESGVQVCLLKSFCFSRYDVFSMI